MDNFTIHIGYQKAGSSTLQAILSRSGEVCYDRSLPTRLLDASRFEPLAEWLNNLRQEAGGKPLFLSNEHLVGELDSTLKQEMYAQKLFQAFPEAKVLMLIRSQTTILRSLYDEVVRSRHVFKSFQSWLQNYFQAGKLDYYKIYALYRQHYGDNFRVFLLEEMAEDLPGFLAQVAGFMGISAEKVITAAETGDSQRNPRLEKNLIASFRALNLLDRLMQKLTRSSKRSVFWRWKRALSKEINDEQTPLPRKRLFCLKIVGLVFSIIMNTRTDIPEGYLEQFCESNHKLQQALGKDLRKYGYPL